MIRKMRREDVPQIAALERLCFSDPWSEASISSELENPISLWLVAEADGVVQGYIGSQSAPPDCDIMNLAVAPDARRQQLGRTLLQSLIDELHRRGTERLFLEVRASNAPAQSLYASFGFEQVGLRKEYYVNPTEDALILRKELCHADPID